MADETQVVQTDTATQPDTNTQPQATNVDIDAIAKIATREAEKKMQAVVTDMLKQQGLDNDSIKEMVKEWKSARTTPEKELESANRKIADLQNDLTAALNRKDPEKDAILSELTTLKQERYLEKQGIPANFLKIYRIGISELVTEDTDFEKATAKFIKENPLPVAPELNKPANETPPPYVVPTQGTVKPNSKKTTDPLVAAFAKGARIKLQE